MVIVKILARWIGLRTQGVVNIFEEDEEFRYPCSMCLVSVMCSQLCDKLIQPTVEYNKKIETFVESHLKRNKCPDCGCENSITDITIEPYIVIDYKCSNCKHTFISSRNKHFFYGRE